MLKISCFIYLLRQIDRLSRHMSNVPQECDNFRWTILALVSMSHIFGASAQYGINTLAPFYQDDLGLSHAQVGLFFTAFSTHHLSRE